MIRLDGWGQFDARENDSNDRKKNEHSNPDRGGQGFLLNDSQFKSLTGGLDPSKYLRHQVQLRAELNYIREFVLKSHLRHAEIPTRAEINKALVLTGRQARVFLDRISELAVLPDWHLADPAAVEYPSPFHVFVTMPWRLRSCADRARSEARIDKHSAVSMIALSHAADGLADILMALDFGSQNELLEQLRWTADYDLNHLTEIVHIIERVQVGLNDAVHKKRGGPIPRNDLKQATIWLGDLFESYKGPFTHNPYEKTKYDGRPHSAAGRFVLAFLRTCNSSISEAVVSYYMAEAVRFRNRRERSLRMGARERSS